MSPFFWKKRSTTNKKADTAEKATAIMQEPTDSEEGNSAAEIDPRLFHYEESVFEIGTASEIGRRAKNDDYVKIDARNKMVAIADGIGGAPFGDIISRVACNVAIESFACHKDLVGAFAAANSAAVRLAHNLDTESDGSGSTLLLASYSNDWIDIAYAGDTYAFSLNAEGLTRLTNEGRLEGNALSSCIGYETNLYPRVLRIAAVTIDSLILCTDGVWSSLADDQIAQIVDKSDTARNAADALAQAAARSGTDNATAAILRKRSPQKPKDANLPKPGSARDSHPFPWQA